MLDLLTLGVLALTVIVLLALEDVTGRSDLRSDPRKKKMRREVSALARRARRSR